MNSRDFIDFMTGGLAYACGFLTMIEATSGQAITEKIHKICLDPALHTEQVMLIGGTSLFFGALHALYRYQGHISEELTAINKRIEYYNEQKSQTTTKRYSLFSETNKSYFSSALESARKLLNL